MIFHPASNEHTAHTSEGSLIQSQETQTPSGHATSRGLPSCSAASAALSPAPKLPGIIRQPRAGPECSTLTTRTNLRADLCFCNGHLTPCESWLCSCSCSFRPVISCALETRAIVSTAFLSLSLAGGRCDGMGAGLLPTALPTKIRPGKRRSISRVFPRVSPHPSASPQRGAQDQLPP